MLLGREATSQPHLLRYPITKEMEKLMCHNALLKIFRVLVVFAFITSLPAYGGNDDVSKGGGGSGGVSKGCKIPVGISVTSGVPPANTPEIVKVNLVPQIEAESSPIAVKIAPHESATDWWLVVPTWLLAIFTFTLWRATKQMVKETVISSQNAQRAFVFIKNFDVNFQQVNQVIINPVWENSGDTPTKKMRNHVNWTYFVTDIPPDFDFPDITGEESTAVLIGPHATLNTSPLEINMQCIDNVAQGKGHLYIWGWAEYNDVFENTNRHRTEFCSEVLISKISETEISIRFRLYKLHNGADEECIKKLITEF